jgi:hypothetical protein
MYLDRSHMDIKVKQSLALSQTRCSFPSSGHVVELHTHTAP